MAGGQRRARHGCQTGKRIQKFVPVSNAADR
jgi:hypothetical protein